MQALIERFQKYVPFSEEAWALIIGRIKKTYMGITLEFLGKIRKGFSKKI